MTMSPNSSPSWPLDAAITDLGHLRLLARVAEQVGEGVAVFDRDDHVIYSNPALASMHNTTPDRLLGLHVSAFAVTPNGYRPFDEDEAVAGPAIRRAEMTTRRLDGSFMVTQVTISSLRDDSGDRVGRIVCVQDVSERKALERRLERAAYYDPLTDLGNRRLLLERLESALAAPRSGHVCLMFIDFDGFKQINDLHGHELGDELLIAAAERLQQCARPADTAARFGGDEFVLLLDDVDGADEARLTADRIALAMSQPFTLGVRTVSISASVGVAIGNSLGHRSLLRAADAAMYEAKASGAAKVVITEVAH